MLGAPLNTRTIAKTMADQKSLKRDVEYIEMGNQWILLRFANSNDLFLVWSESPWHVCPG